MEVANREYLYRAEIPRKFAVGVGLCALSITVDEGKNSVKGTEVGCFELEELRTLSKVVRTLPMRLCCLNPIELICDEHLLQT